MKFRVLALVLALLMLIVIPVYAEGSGERVGITFTAETKYIAKEVVTAPNTFEAWVNIPKNLSGRGGVILSTYGNGSPNFSFEIHENGVPRLYVEDAETTLVKNDIDVKFSGIDLRTGEWTHVAIVRDGTSLKCYVNGELKQTKTISFTDDIVATLPVCLGGDYRSGNVQYFKGQISSAALYSDARTQSEIVADMLSYGNDGLLCAYEASAMTASGVMKDKSGNGADMVLNKIWFTDKEPVTDYAYSFAVIGDTQRVSFNDPDKFHIIYDWLLDNAESKKIKYVMGLGDITEKSAQSEWEIAAEQIKRLNGIIPYSVVRGNHDNANDFTSYFPMGEYEDIVSGAYNGNMLNTYTRFNVGETKYLVMTLDYGASDEVLKWASAVVKFHADHNVIVTTHAYLYRNGTTLDQNEVCPPATTGGYNNGDHMWDKFIKNHENIVLVISGHDPCDNVIVAQDEGVNGNIVTQMLIDPQGTDNEHGSTGMVCMLYFSEDGRDVTVEYYSTIKEQYFMTSNQFTMTIDMVGADNDASDTPTTPDKPETPDEPETPDDSEIPDDFETPDTDASEPDTDDIINGDESDIPSGNPDSDEDIGETDGESNSGAANDGNNAPAEKENGGEPEAKNGTLIIVILIIIACVVVAGGAVAVVVVLKKKKNN